MPQTILPIDVHVGGVLSAKQWNLADDVVADANVQAGADLDATKMKHRHAALYAQADGADVASETQLVGIVRGTAGTIRGVEVVTTTAPTGGDKKFTVDVQKGNQSTGYATVLSSVITIDSAVSDREVVAGTLSVTSLADGDSLKVVVTASGSTGSQAQGAAVVVSFDEDAS